MSTKPVDLARWGETSGGTETTNLTIASSGHQDTGWTLSEAPTSGLFNWLANRAYKWFKWLDDGDCTFHNLGATGTLTQTGGGASSLSGTLAVAGATALSSSLSVAGTLTQTGGGATALSGTLGVTGNTTVGGTLGVTGNTTVGGTLGVTGNTTVGGTLGVTGNTTVSGTLSVTGLITATAGLTAAANQHVTVSGNGLFKHGLVTLRLPALNGLPLNSSDTWTQDAGGVKGTPLFSWTIPITLPDGKRILNLRVRVKDNATGPTKLTFISTKAVDGSETGFGGAAVVSAGTGAYQTLIKSAVNETLAAGTNYYVNVFTSTGSALGSFAWLEVDYDQP
jgi:hypothetical protein